MADTFGTPYVDASRNKKLWSSSTGRPCISYIILCLYNVDSFCILWNYLGHTCKNLLEIFDGRKSTNIANVIPKGSESLFCCYFSNGGLHHLSWPQSMECGGGRVEARKKKKK